MEGIAWGALGAFISVVVTVFVTQGLKVKAQWTKDRIAREEAQGKIRQGETAEQRQARREARDEYRDLYIEVRQELTQSRQRERSCERRLARLEAMWEAKGEQLPPLTDDTGEHKKLEGGNVS